MNRQKQFYPPQTTAKIPSIEFEIVDTRQRHVKTNDIFLSRSAEVVKTNDTILSNDNDKVLTHVRTFDRQSIDRFIDRTKPVVKVIVKTLTKTCQASAYLTGFIVVNVVKYSFVFVGAVVGGLVMSVVDICQNHSSGVVEFDNDDDNVDTCQNQFTINASGNSTVNIQINNR